MSPQKRLLIQPPDDEGLIPREYLKAVVEGVHLVPDEQGELSSNLAKNGLRFTSAPRKDAHQLAKELF